MCKRLRKISKMFSCRSKFFRIQSKMVCLSEHFFEKKPRFLCVTGPREALDKPERAHAERSFVPCQPVVAAISIDQRIVQQIPFDCIECREPSRIRWTNKFHQRREQRRSIKHRAALCLNKAFHFLVPELAVNLVIDRI